MNPNNVPSFGWPYMQKIQLWVWLPEESDVYAIASWCSCVGFSSSVSASCRPGIRGPLHRCSFLGQNTGSALQQSLTSMATFSQCRASSRRSGPTMSTFWSTSVIISPGESLLLPCGFRCLSWTPIRGALDRTSGAAVERPDVAAHHPPVSWSTGLAEADDEVDRHCDYEGAEEVGEQSVP
jgi:hypothetical protein